MSTPPGRLDLLVRGGTVVGSRRTATTDVGIADGRIARIGRIPVSAAREVVDADGLVVLPGWVDAHTHFAWGKFPAGERSVDDYRTGTAGAAVGGVTTVVDYIRQPPDTTLRETVAARRTMAAPDAIVDFSFHVVPTDRSPGTLAEIPALVADGLPTFKLFLNRADDAWLLRFLRAVGAAGGLAMLHCETAAIIDEAIEGLERDGLADAHHWAIARPRASEETAVARAIAFCRATRTPVCLVHLSTSVSLALVTAAKREGLPVRAETRPGYLLLTEDRYADPDPRHLWATGSPPFRDAAAVDAVWDGIRRGVVDTIASDHAAYTIEQKRPGDRDLRNLPAGVPSLETQLGATFATGVGEGRVSLRRFVDVTAAGPARLLGLYPMKGVIAVGSDADLVLVDPARRHTVRGADLHGRAGYDPLEGRTFTGWPVATVAGGEVVARDGRLLGEPGRGRFLARTPPTPGATTRG